MKRKPYKALLCIITALLTLECVILIILALYSKPAKGTDPPVISAETNQSEKLISVSPICQYPLLPTGCESACAAMVLRYYGCDITAEEFAENILNKAPLYYENGIVYGPNPKEFFVGSPFSADGYGCYASAIVDSVASNLPGFSAKNISGESLRKITKDYIDRGIPVLIWATMGMNESKEGSSWLLENGEKFTWISGEHCLVLVGYSETSYYLLDPSLGSLVTYEKSLVENRFEELNRQALYFYKNS